MFGGPTGTLSQVLSKWMKPAPQGLVRYYSPEQERYGLNRTGHAIWPYNSH